MAHQLYEPLIQRVMLQLMTNTPEANTDPQQLAEAYYKTLPEHLHTAIPHHFAAGLNRFLHKRLKNLSNAEIQTLLKPVESQAKTLSPEALVVSRYIIDQRRLGLNWRIDAMKDLGDMDYVMDHESNDRAEVFEGEFSLVKSVMQELKSAIHSVFPKAGIIGEITDLNFMAGNASDAQDWFENRLFKVQHWVNKIHQIVTSMTSFDFLFSSPNALFKMTDAPHSPGDTTLKTG